jgi:UDP-N-acetyl-D-glucosamine dehydrogenase
MNKAKSVAIVGLCYVGLPLALLAKKNGLKVTGVDINPKVVSKISNINATTDFSKIKTADIVVICVPTPVYPTHRPDYRPVDTACRQVAFNMHSGQLIILESTVNPGYCDDRAIPIIEKVTKMKVGQNFYFAHCPERINPGDPKWHVGNIPRVVGGNDPKSLKMAIQFYKSVISAPITPMNSLKEAEAVKITENSFRNINLAFVNELAMSFAKLGIDVVNVIKGASTKPFSFLPHYPGCGVGGHCIPVDPHYLIDYAHNATGFNHKFLKLACKVNDFMPHYTVSLLEAALKRQQIPISGTKVAVLGLAYKAGISDTRESPALEIISLLKSKKAQVICFDPYVPQLSTAKTLLKAVQNAKAVVIATNHAQFLKLSPISLSANGVKIVIDGRNFLPKQEFVAAGIDYQGIGR